MSRHARAIVAFLAAYLVWTGAWSIGWWVGHDPEFLIIPQAVLVFSAVVFALEFAVLNWVDRGDS